MLQNTSHHLTVGAVGILNMALASSMPLIYSLGAISSRFPGVCSWKIEKFDGWIKSTALEGVSYHETLD